MTMISLLILLLLFPAYSLADMTIDANNTTIKAVVINKNDSLTINAGLTGVELHNCTVASTGDDEFTISSEPSKMINIAIPGEVTLADGLDLGGAGTIENVFFSESEAVIEAKSTGTINAGVTDCEFSFTDWSFVDETGEDYNLTKSSGLVNTGSSNTEATEDADGIAMPQKGFYDVGAYELESTYWGNPSQRLGWWYFW